MNEWYEKHLYIYISEARGPWRATAILRERENVCFCVFSIWNSSWPRVQHYLLLSQVRWLEYCLHSNSSKWVPDSLQSWGRLRPLRERRWATAAPFTSHAHLKKWNHNIHCSYSQPAIRLTFTFIYLFIYFFNFVMFLLFWSNGSFSIFTELLHNQMIKIETLMPSSITLQL